MPASETIEIYLNSKSATNYINNQISANVETTVDNEIWDYLGITADMDIPPFDASMTSYSNSRVQNLPISADHVYYIFNIL